MCHRFFIVFAVNTCLSFNICGVEAQQPTAVARPGIVDLPDGFAESVIATRITGATAMAIAPDGRMFVCEQTGALRVVKDDVLLDQPFVTVAVDSSWERGLIGVTLHPDFPMQPFVYVCYVSPEPYPHHRVSRFTAQGDIAAPDSEVILLQGDDQTKLGGGVPNGHQGGPLQFGKDGKLYIALGEQTAGSPSQKLDTLQGKLLRINPDGSMPVDNPFFQTTAGKYRSIWATGLRNPFALAVQPVTGRMFFNDVGDARWEEINEVQAAANYGWPHSEGPTTDARFQGPIYAYDRSQGRSITGGVFYNPPVEQFPKDYVGKYFFAEFMDQWIRVLDPEHPMNIRPFASGLSGPVSLQVGPDGSLYVLNRNAWVKDGKFQPETGSLHRVSFVANSGRPAPLIAAQPTDVSAGTGSMASFSVAATGQSPLRFQWYRNSQPVTGATEPTLSVSVAGPDDGTVFRCQISNIYGSVRSRPATLWTTPLPRLLETLRVGQDPATLPRLLSQTGLFLSLRDLSPEAGVVPYDVNSPLWSDGALKRRWIVLPTDAPIGFAERGAWKFPAGTVFVKHFELPAGEGRTAARRLETRLLVVDRRGTGYGVTYKWRADGSDAELMAGGLTEEIDVGDRKQTWTYPTRNDCLICHTSNAGFVLGVNTRQLNHPTEPATDTSGNLLREWSRRGLFQTAIRDDDIPRFQRLTSMTDSSASLEHRVRSYLDSNCAQCHRPGGTRGEFDARFETPLDRQRLVNGPLVSSDMGIADVKLVSPGRPDRSMVHLRMKRRQDVFNMPPLATHEVDPAAVATVAAWIQSLTQNFKR